MEKKTIIPKVITGAADTMMISWSQYFGSFS